MASRLGPLPRGRADKTGDTVMLLNLSQIGQIALPTSDVDRSEAFYEKVVGLRKLFRFGDLTFFDCAGVRLLIEKVHGGDTVKPQGCIYFRCADIALAVSELEKRGLTFTSKPHLIARMVKAPRVTINLRPRRVKTEERPAAVR